jgi:phosphoribosylanthranilate isomerase
MARDNDAGCCNYRFPVYDTVKNKADKAKRTNVFRNEPGRGHLSVFMETTRVKICGITSVADGLAAAEAGADMIGLMLYDKSPRFITLGQAVEISRALPPHLMRVGVFVNPDEALVAQAIRDCGLGLLQFHGDEPSDFCTQFGVMSMKALRVKDADSLRALEDFHTEAFLLDAYSKNGLGGTGEKFNWDLAVEAQKFGKPIFLAGGLTPENVAAAVRQVRPFAVDVSSGVESAPGKKDAAKVKAFIAAAKGA